jgi:hypothetical protein
VKKQIVRGLGLALVSHLLRRVAQARPITLETLCLQALLALTYCSEVCLASLGLEKVPLSGTVTTSEPAGLRQASERCDPPQGEAGMLLGVFG